MGICIVCQSYVEGTEVLTCNHPQCVKEVKEVYGKWKEFLEEYECETLEKLEDYIDNFKSRIEELKTLGREIRKTAVKMEEI